MNNAPTHVNIPLHVEDTGLCCLHYSLAINVPIETEHIRTVNLFSTILSHFEHTDEPTQIEWLLVR